jgi:Flp pilus assembly protein TadD
MALYQGNEFSQAVPLLARASELQPLDPELLAYHANAQFKAGEAAPAIEKFRRAIDLKEKARWTWTSLAWMDGV